MKAILWTAYGSAAVLQLREVEKPAPKDNEILIKVCAAAVTAGDCEMRNLQFPIWIRLPMRFYVGIRKPTRVTIPGTYLAGEVEARGKDVKRFAVGDPIFGFTGFHFGAHAEYVCMPENGVIITKPANMDYEEAAPVALGGLEALHFIRKSKLQAGQHILINGAGGSIGTYAVQLAKLRGATVTAVDRAGKLEMLRSLGADHVIDYTKEDFTTNGQTYDVIFDVVLQSPFSRMFKSLTANGIYLLTNPTLPKIIQALWTSATSNRKVIYEPTNPNTKDLQHLKEVIEAGKLRTVIDRRYPLEHTADAHRYIETGQKKGNVVVTMVHHHGA